MLKALGFTWVFLFSSLSLALQLDAQSEKQLRSIIHQSTMAWNERNLAKFASFFSEDAVFINIYGEKFIGRKAIQDRQVKLFENPSAKLIISEEEIDLSVLDIGVARAVIKWTIQYDTPAIGPIQGIWTMIFAVFDEKLLIVSAHNTKIPTAKL